MTEIPLGTAIKFWCEECDDEVHNVYDPGFFREDGKYYAQVRDASCNQDHEEIETTGWRHTWLMVTVDE